MNNDKNQDGTLDLIINYISNHLSLEEKNIFISVKFIPFQSIFFSYSPPFSLITPSSENIFKVFLSSILINSNQLNEKKLELSNELPCNDIIEFQLLEITKKYNICLIPIEIASHFTLLKNIKK